MSNFPILRRIVAESLMIPETGIAPETPIVALPNIDSLAFELIVVGIESEIGREIGPEELMGAVIVEDLLKLFERS